MRYKVIYPFADLHDKKYKYEAGDEFPRQGLEVSEDRIEELMGSKNKIKKPLIEKVIEENENIFNEEEENENIFDEEKTDFFDEIFEDIPEEIENISEDFSDEIFEDVSEKTNKKTTKRKE